MRPFLALALLTGALGHVACAVLAAPAPLPRHHARDLAPADFVGAWALHWDGEECPTILSKGGAYLCKWRGSTYVGWWRWQSGRLEVTEALEESPLELPPPDQFSTWVVPLQRDEKGRFDRRRLRGQAWYDGSSVPFELRRPKK